MLDNVFKIIYLHQCIFDNNAYINSILFKFLSHKLLANIGGNKVWGPKICINPSQV